MYTPDPYGPNDLKGMDEMSRPPQMDPADVAKLGNVGLLCSLVMLSAFYSRYQILAFCTGIVSERVISISSDLEDQAEAAARRMELKILKRVADQFEDLEVDDKGDVETMVFFKRLKQYTTKTVIKGVEDYISEE